MSTLREHIEAIRLHRADVKAQPHDSNARMFYQSQCYLLVDVHFEELDALIPPIKPCRWTQMDQGGHSYNTCEPNESFRIEPGCEPYPCCCWCGKPVELVPRDQWGDDDE